jgi:hypothetical protein
LINLIAGLLPFVDDNRTPLAFPGLDLQALGDLSYLTATDGVDCLKAQARCLGFKLLQRDSSCSDRVRLCCHREDCGKGTKTTKTDCPVKLRLRKREGEYHIHLDPELRHNHPFPRYPDQEITGEIGEIIRDMLKIALPNTKIIEFVELRTGTYITPADLETYRNSAFKNASLTETDHFLSILDNGD